MADATNTTSADTTSSSTTQQTTVETADQLAQDMGYSSAQEMLSEIKDALTNGTIVSQSQAQADAASFTGKLILLVLYQEIESRYRLEPYSWVNKFESQKIEAGNTKQFIRNIITGGDTFDENQFVPNKVTNPKVDTATISLYNRDSSGNDNLSTYGFKYKKPLTISRQLWLPYFMSGKLQEFIDSIVKLVNESFEIFKITILQKMIGDAKTGISKKVTGTATNILTCFTNEIYPMLTEMNFLNSDYNINMNGTTTSINSTGKEDLLIFVSNKVYTMLNAGVMSQIYNYKLANIEQYINLDNIVPCSKQLISGDSDTPITIDTNPLIGDNEILVLNKNCIKQLFWVNQTESQSWATNMTLQIVLHVWGAFGFIPWGQGFYYTNNNLSVLPS